MKPLQRLELIKDLIQEAVDSGATSVEQIHQYVADLPFEALQRSGLLTDDKLQLRERKRQTIGFVYDAIRRINRQVGELISEQFAHLEDGAEAARTLRENERRAAAKAAAPKGKPRRKKP